MDETGMELAPDKITLMDRICKQSFFLTQLSDKPRFRVLVIIFTNLTFLFCLFYHNCYSVIMIYRMTQNDAKIWEMLPRFLTCPSIAVSMNTSIYKYDVVCKMNAKFYRYFEILREKNTPLLQFPKATCFILYGFLYVVFCLLIVILTIFLSPSAPDRDVWVKMICSVGFCNFTSLPESTKNTIYSRDLLFYSLATVSSTVFVNMMYCYSCLSIISLSKTASRYTRSLVEKSNDVDGISRDLVLRTRLFCQDVKILLGHANDVFSPILVFFYGAALLCACHFITRAIAWTDSLSLLQISLYFILYGQSFIGVFIISWVSSKIPEMFNNIYIEMQSLTLNRNNVPLDVYAELNILLSQIQTQPLGVSLGGFFLITRNFYISYLGTMITFVVILIQFNFNYK